MIEAAHSELLQYRDQAFAIHHLIADCPPGTVIRELTKNAEENAGLMEPPGRIEWFTEMVEGVPKLGLYNEGPGMDGKPAKYKSVTKMPDPDTMEMTMYIGDGKDPMFSVTYKRKK